MTISDSIQIKQHKFHQRRIMETKLTVIVGVFLSFIIILIWHLRLAHELKELELKTSEISFTKVDYNLVTTKLQQYAAKVEEITRQNQCLQNLFINLNQVFPEHLQLTILEKSNGSIKFLGQTQVLSAITKLMENLGKCEKYKQHLLQIKTVKQTQQLPEPTYYFGVEVQCQL